MKDLHTMTENKKSSVYNSFSIIRQRGTPKKGQLPDGTWVYARDKFWIPDLHGYVNCMRYDDHFLYEIPENIRHLYPGAIYRCSCGSQAIYVGLQGYIFGASPQGLMWVCQFFTDNGHHATGGDRWI